MAVTPRIFLQNISFCSFCVHVLCCREVSHLKLSVLMLLFFTHSHTRDTHTLHVPSVLSPEHREVVALVPRPLIICPFNYECYMLRMSAAARLSQPTAHRETIAAKSTPRCCSCIRPLVIAADTQSRHFAPLATCCGRGSRCCPLA